MKWFDYRPIFYVAGVVANADAIYIVVVAAAAGITVVVAVFGLVISNNNTVVGAVCAFWFRLMLLLTVVFRSLRYTSNLLVVDSTFMQRHWIPDSWIFIDLDDSNVFSTAVNVKHIHSSLYRIAMVFFAMKSFKWI